VPEDNVRREAGKKIVDGIEDYEIKIRLLLGSEETLSEALRQALELHAVLIAARSQRSNNGAYSGLDRPHPTETQGVLKPGITRKLIIFVVGRRQMTGTSTVTKVSKGHPGTAEHAREETE
jgi:hypothetical protein